MFPRTKGASDRFPRPPKLALSALVGEIRGSLSVLPHPLRDGNRRCWYCLAFGCLSRRYPLSNWQDPPDSHTPQHCTPNVYLFIPEETEAGSEMERDGGERPLSPDAENPKARSNKSGRVSKRSPRRPPQA